MKKIYLAFICLAISLMSTAFCSDSPSAFKYMTPIPGVPIRTYDQVGSNKPVAKEPTGSTTQTPVIKEPVHKNDQYESVKPAAEETSRRYVETPVDYSNGFGRDYLKGIVQEYAPASNAPLSGLAGYFAKKNKGLACSIEAGEKSPYYPICMDDAVVWHQLNAEPDTYQYVIKAFQKNGIKECAKARYIIVADTSIENKMFNSVYFKLPKFQSYDAVHARVTQISLPYTFNKQSPELTTKIVYNSKETGPTVLPMTTTLMNSREGIFQRTAQLKNPADDTVMLVTSYDGATSDASTQVYALVVELFVR